MTAGSGGDDKDNTVSSLPLTEETTTSKEQQLTISTETLTSQPTLPFELIEEEILCRLPVKLLLQLRCICKSWNSLISNPKFAKKHLRSSKKRHRLILYTKNNQDEFFFHDSPISSVFSTSRAPKLTQISYPITPTNDTYCVPRCWSSCDGIFCFPICDNSAVLWNPSIRKFKILPPLDNPQKTVSCYSFGYDHFIDNYKIIGISLCTNLTEVSVLTVGDDYWRRIPDFPYSGGTLRQGIFVSGTVNWFAYDSSSYSRVIVSLDLEKESYQKLPQPDLDNNIATLGVLRDCLCFFARNRGFLDVWIMKEYGNKESWTKLHTIPNMTDRGLHAYTKVLYVSEDGKMLLDFLELASKKLKLVVYDSKNDTLKNLEIQNINRWVNPKVYIESLISPCS